MLIFDEKTKTPWLLISSPRMHSHSICRWVLLIIKQSINCYKKNNLQCLFLIIDWLIHVNILVNVSSSCIHIDSYAKAKLHCSSQHELYTIRWHWWNEIFLCYQNELKFVSIFAIEIVKYRAINYETTRMRLIFLGDINI